MIWKYTLERSNYQEVEMPYGARILSVAMQYGEICIWCIVYENRERGARMVEIVGTGHDFPEANNNKVAFIGTVIDGNFVWHVFDCGYKGVLA